MYGVLGMLNRGVSGDGGRICVIFLRKRLGLRMYGGISMCKCSEVEGGRSC